ncbi:MAG TPA: hypothetical protein VFD92_10200 [Candidatus Binatia bacterium]|nr:hypothetical protein [Candidatus Binatia bacterium]
MTTTARHHQVSGRTAALLPPCFFAAAALFFAAALTASPFVAGRLLVHFYDPAILALTHMLTLGWISMTMMGVLYRYVPALVKRPLPFPRLAWVQWSAFAAGVVGMAASFAVGAWNTTAAFAALVLVSAALLCATLWPLLRAAPNRGVAEIGIAAGSGFFVVAALLGTLLAANKTAGFLSGGTFTNLGAHVALAALGWVATIACALSFRFLPAFLLPELDRVEAARKQVVALAALVVVLAVALLAGSDVAWPAAFGVAAVLAVHVWLLLRVVASHRLPLDWTAWHAIVAACWCLAAVAGGIAVAVEGVQSAVGARFAAVYGVAGLVGWLSNLIIGVSYKLFPAFVTSARSERARPGVPLAALGVPERIKPAVFALFNAGVAIAVAGLLLDEERMTAAGAAIAAAGGVSYAAATLRTLAFVLVDPRGEPDPLAIVP